jgi:hypothetical protein
MLKDHVLGATDIFHVRPTPTTVNCQNKKSRKFKHASQAPELAHYIFPWLFLPTIRLEREEIEGIYLNLQRSEAGAQR